jgi:6-pyruvoyltetrahydropterin/6-carboxytetrahydropterin synthase
VFVIAKRFTFSASHQLPGLPVDHQCARLHGHNYVVEVQLAAKQLDGHGFVVDFHKLAPVGDYIDTHWDHRHLNDVLDLPPTSENLAQLLFVWCEYHLPHSISQRLYAVRVSETGSTWAERRCWTK